jgi:hypothetical protein
MKKKVFFGLTLLSAVGIMNYTSTEGVDAQSYECPDGDKYVCVNMAGDWIVWKGKGSIKPIVQENNN